MLSVDFVFHPADLTVAAPTLSLGGLIDVVDYKATLPVGIRHILIVITLGLQGSNSGVLSHDIGWNAAVQFGNVTKGVRSLNGIR